nr:hypothetical protein CFP56_64159 [Quercus suber]
MQPTFPRRVNYGTQGEATSGFHPWNPRQNYKNFKSAHGPSYQIGTHLKGLNRTNGLYYATVLGGFGAVAGIFALFFFDGVPRVRKDILQKVPVIGGYFVKEVAPEDNPF